MWTTHDLIVVAHTAVVGLILCLVALLASDVRAGESMTFGTAVPRSEPASLVIGSD